MLRQIFLHPCSKGIISWLLFSRLWNHRGSFPDRVHSQISLPVQALVEWSFQALGSHSCTLARVSSGSCTLLCQASCWVFCVHETAVCWQSLRGRLSSPSWAEWHRILLPCWRKKKNISHRDVCWLINAEWKIFCSLISAVNWLLHAEWTVAVWSSNIV